MLNPSTADWTADDATIRKCMGFALRWECAGIWVVNLFALRARQPTSLACDKDPVGPENDQWVGDGIAYSRVVAAWGATGGSKVARLVSPRAAWLRSVAADVAADLACLGTCADGSPRHPLMLAYDTPLVDWPVSP
jgi:hypothetical protein